MKLKDQEAWEKKKAVEADSSYGMGTLNFAERWADLMESKFAKGMTVADIAKDTSHDADTEGITGFMYGAAVGILSVVWEHGEELRRWHNLDAQIGTEGEKANEQGGTLNPALINIQPK